MIDIFLVWTQFASASYKGPIHVWTTSEEDVDEVNQDSEEVDVARKRRRLNDRAVPVKVQFLSLCVCGYHLGIETI